TVTPDGVDDPHLDVIAPALDADWVARVGDDRVLHVECQGYRDPGFPERLFWYHVSLVVQYRPRRVDTVGLWLIAPPGRQRASVIEQDNLTLRVTSMVIPEVAAEDLLVDPRTACFAAGASAGAWSEAELCARVA